MRAFGWQSESVPIPFTPLASEVVFADTEQPDAHFLKAVNDWAKITPALNEIAASLGHSNLYPFIFSPRTARKMAFVNATVQRYAGRRTMLAA